MIQIPKPLDPQAFERHCVVLWRLLLNNPAAALYGRNGQDQHGVDILGYRDGRSDQPVGIQCKLRTQGIVLSRREIISEVTEALIHHKDLVEYYIVTTAPSSVKLQNLAADLTKEWKSKSKIRQISIWGWEILQEHIVRHPEAIKAFDPNYSPFIEEIAADQKEIAKSLRHGDQRLAAIYEKLVEIASLETGIPVSAIHGIISQNGYKALTPEEAIASLKSMSEDLKTLMRRSPHMLEGGDVMLIEERRAQALLKTGDLEGYASELEGALVHRREHYAAAVKSQYELLTKVSKAREIQQRFDDAIACLEEAARLFKNRKDIPSEPFIIRWQIAQLTYLKACKTNEKNLFDDCRMQMDDLQNDLHVKSLDFLKVRLLTNRYIVELASAKRTFDYDNIFREIEKLNNAWCLMGTSSADDIHQHAERSCDIRFFIGRATDDQNIMKAALKIARGMRGASNVSSGDEKGQLSRTIVSQSLVAKISAFMANRGWANASKALTITSRIVEDLLDLVSRTPPIELSLNDVAQLSSAIAQVALLSGDKSYVQRLDRIYSGIRSERRDPEFIRDILAFDAAHALLHLQFWTTFRQPNPYKRINELTKIAKAGLQFQDHWQIGVILELQADCYACESLLHGDNKWNIVIDTYMASAASFQKVFEVSPIFAQRALWRARNKALTLGPSAYM